MILLSSPDASAETRSLKLIHLHTGEKAEIIFKRNGRYDQAGLKKINYLLRDWRKNQPTTMNPRLLDLIWEAYRESGATGYINVVCGYRSPQTNSMLRSRSKGVAEKSQHMLGNAMDFFIPGVKLKRLREIGLKMQGGGVGYYPTSGSPFVHFDVGNVRHWPKMSRQELVALFPNGKTLHVPSDGKPLPGFEQALAAYKSRKSSGELAIASAAGGAKSSGGARRGLLSALFGGGADEEEDVASASAGDAAPLRRSMRDDAAPAVARASGKAAAAPKAEAADEAAPVAAAKRAPAKPEPLPGIQIVSPADATPAELPREPEPATPETVIAALSPRSVPLPVAAPRAEDAPKIEEAVTDAVTDAASATPAVVADKPPAELDAEAPLQLAADVPLPTWRPMEEAPVVAAAVEREAAPDASEPDAAVLTALAEAEGPRSKAAALLAPVPAERPLAPSVAALEAAAAVKPTQVAAAGTILPDSALVPGAAPLNGGKPGDAAVLAAARAAAKRKQVELASLGTDDERLSLASAFAGMPSHKVKPPQEAMGGRPAAVAAAAAGAKGGRNLAAAMFTNVKTTGKEGRPTRRDLKPDAQPVRVEAEPAAARWAIYGDKVATVTNGTQAPSFAHNLVRTAPSEVYTVGFQQGEPQADAGRFTGKAVTFLSVARFETN